MAVDPATTTKRTRQLLQLSQAAMAQLIGLPLRSYQELEQGRVSLRRMQRLVIKIAEMNPEAVENANRALDEEDRSRHLLRCRQL